MFLNSDFRNEIGKYQSVILSIFAMFHPNVTEIQPLKVLRFSMKTLKFQHSDVISYDVTRDFKILLCMWTRLVMGYTSAKFHYDTSIRQRVFHVFFMYFLVFIYKWTAVSENDIIIYDVVIFLEISFNIFGNTVII